MPFKANQDRRHHIPRQRYQVTNWPEYDGALRQRGSPTVWFSEAAIAAWRAERRNAPGGQPRYSALAIATALTLRAVFRLALRQTEGLIGSVGQPTAEHGLGVIVEGCDGKVVEDHPAVAAAGAARPVIPVESVRSAANLPRRCATTAGARSASSSGKRPC